MNAETLSIQDVWDSIAARVLAQVMTYGGNVLHSSETTVMSQQ
jgi:hypothetical protein